MQVQILLLGVDIYVGVRRARKTPGSLHPAHLPDTARYPAAVCQLAHDNRD